MELFILCFHLLVFSFLIITIILFREITRLEKNLGKYGKVLDGLMKAIYKAEKSTEEKIFEEFEVKK